MKGDFYTRLIDQKKKIGAVTNSLKHGLELSDVILSIMLNCVDDQMVSF